MTATEPSQTTPIVNDRRRQLRVKIKSLAAEARIIRQEERRCRDSMTRCVGHDAERAAIASSFASLRAHRVTDVRRESRYSLLVYAILRERPLRLVEAKSDASKIDKAKLADILSRFAAFGTTKAQAAVMVDEWLAFLVTAATPAP